jgi:CheY-like chemotaxis protein
MPADDRDNIQDGDRILLIVDVEKDRAEHTLGLAREHGFKGIIAARPENTIALAHEFNPHGVIIMPEDEGWMAFDRLKRDLMTRHIPVQIVGENKDRQRALALGAFGFIETGSSDDVLANGLEAVKGFLDRAVKNLLVVEDNEGQRKAILDLIGNGDVQTVAVATGEEALAGLRSSHFDCMVVDLGLPDMSGFDLLERLKKELGLYDLPVIVYTAKELSAKEETRLRRLSESIIVKDARSPERLLADTSLFLHRASAKLPPAKRKILEEEQRTDPVLAGKKVLVVDDDVRNIFSLTSLLERHRIEVLFAENGRDAIELLKHTPDVDAILADVMMPDVDGYETMREIRKMRRFKSTPIIALTAKAMKGDREKCIEAGAADYVSKPADVDRLLSLLRFYLGR